MDLLPEELTKGQIYQSTISASLFLIYILVLTGGVVLGKIDTSWIIDRFVGLTFIGVILLIIFPIYRSTDTVLQKVMKQMGLWSFILLILTWFIYFVQLLNLMQPTGVIEETIFTLTRRFAFYTLFPLLVVLFYGKVEWDEMLNLGDPEN